MEKIGGIGGKAHLYTHPAATDEEAVHDVYVHEEEEHRIGLNDDDDGEYVLEVHHDKRHVSSAKSATFNLVNNIVGGGVLVPPPPNAACSLPPSF